MTGGFFRGKNLRLFFVFSLSFIMILYMTAHHTQELKRITDRIVRYHRPEKIILFGSQAEGHPHRDSDFDLLIIKNFSLPRHERSGAVYRALRGLERTMPVDPLVLSRSELNERLSAGDPFITSIVTNGTVIYEQRSPSKPKPTRSRIFRQGEN